MSFLELDHISKHFGRATAVDDISLTIHQGEFLTLLGPSGCGKTTILRMVAGFEMPDTGNILLDGDTITNRPANKRPMGMVFQSYALFPHMTAEQNIAFGMAIQRKSKEAIQQRCSELLELVGLAEMGRRYPHQLSGGQQQRIALARALAVEPKVLLLDEPLSALDVKVRITLRNEIRRIQQQLRMTAIYVTHDQEEALSLSDRIAVMARGRIEQLDQPEKIYSEPQTAFAATFVGNSNQFRGVVESAADGLCRVDTQTFQVPALPHLHHGSSVLIVIRPEDVVLQSDESGESGESGGSGESGDARNHYNTLTGVVELRTFLGPFTRLQVRVQQTSGNVLVTADIPNQQARTYEMGQHIALSFAPSACKVLPIDATASEMMHQAVAEAV